MNAQAPTERRPSRRALWILVGLIALASWGSGWWVQRQARVAGNALVALVRTGDIELVSSLDCVYCAQARDWLTAQGVPFTECLIERDAVCAARYQALLQPGTPVVLVRGQAQLGFSPERVRQRLLKSG